MLDVKEAISSHLCVHHHICFSASLFPFAPGSCMYFLITRSATSNYFCECFHSSLSSIELSQTAFVQAPSLGCCAIPVFETTKNGFLIPITCCDEVLGQFVSSSKFYFIIIIIIIIIMIACM